MKVQSDESATARGKLSGAHGVDISARFVELAVADAPAGASFERRDARALPFDAEFDAVICLCQGAFGMMRRREDDAAHEVIAVGCAVARISSVEPGAYADGPATTELPELLVIATRT